MLSAELLGIKSIFSFRTDVKIRGIDCTIRWTDAIVIVHAAAVARVARFSRVRIGMRTLRGSKRTSGLARAAGEGERHISCDRKWCERDAFNNIIPI